MSVRRSELEPIFSKRNFEGWQSYYLQSGSVPPFAFARYATTPETHAVSFPGIILPTSYEEEFVGKLSNLISRNKERLMPGSDQANQATKAVLITGGEPHGNKRHDFSFSHKSDRQDYHEIISTGIRNINFAGFKVQDDALDYYVTIEQPDITIQWVEPEIGLRIPRQKSWNTGLMYWIAKHHLYPQFRNVDQAQIADLLNARSVKTYEEYEFELIKAMEKELAEDPHPHRTAISAGNKSYSPAQILEEVKGHTEFGNRYSSYFISKAQDLQVPMTFFFDRKVDPALVPQPTSLH